MQLIDKLINIALLQRIEHCCKLNLGILNYYLFIFVHKTVQSFPVLINVTYHEDFSHIGKIKLALIPELSLIYD